MSIQVDSAFAVPTEIPDLANTISLIARITKDDPASCWPIASPARHSAGWRAKPTPKSSSAFAGTEPARHPLSERSRSAFIPSANWPRRCWVTSAPTIKGLSGLERQFNSELQGKPGKLMISVDARKRWFSSVEKQPEPGNNVVLTVDQNIQYIAERELETAMEQTQADAGTVIVQNPHTGEILALANRPTFNPNLRKEITTEALKDRAVSDIYEPGSAFKIVTISAGAGRKGHSPDELFDCRVGVIVINGLRIRDSKQHGVLSVSDIIAESSNVGAIKVALRLGDDRLYKYIRAFGFGQQTGIELPGETRGMTKTRQSLVEGFHRRDLHGPGDRHFSVQLLVWFRPLPTTESGSRPASLPGQWSRKTHRRRFRFSRRNNGA